VASSSSEAAEASRHLAAGSGCGCDNATALDNDKLECNSKYQLEVKLSQGVLDCPKSTLGP
jgi:hypothetical protein